MFAQINKGSDITKGLRHVTNDQMTHKNHELRASVTAPVTAAKNSQQASPVLGKKPTRPVKPSALAGKRPSKLALEGNKWIVVCYLIIIPNKESHVSREITHQEFFENERNLVIDQGEMSQSVNLFGCKNSILQIRGKVNAVTLGMIRLLFFTLH